jgi:cysteine desulfurase / selenocysteine lyase
MDYRKEFAEFDDVTYLDVATQGPLPLASVQAAKEALEAKKLPFRIPESAYFEIPDRIRGSLASLIHADPEDIALTTGASAGFAAVAAAMECNKDDEVIVARGEFPAHFAAWVPYERAGKVKLKIIDPGGRFITADDYIANITAATKLVTASLVRFDNGARLDARRVADACHAVGALFLIDASQCAGALPIDVNAMGADFLVSSGYKWLLGPYGTGFFWARREWSDRLPPGPVYWQALEGANKFHGLPRGGGARVRPGARRWDMPETGSFIHLAAWDASTRLVASIGAEKIYEHSASLSQLVADRLPLDRCVLASPPERERRGQYVCIAARSPEKTAEMHQKLRAEKVIVCLREGVVRISPHIFNTQQDVLKLISVLSA